MESRFAQDLSQVRVSQMLPQIQPRLTIGAVGEQFEQEADRTADKIVQQSEPQTQSRKDFSGVRIHTDAKAAKSALALNALAYTMGNHIVFASGQYAPQSAVGKTLLAHELTHVVQQQSVVHPVLQRKLDKITQSGCNFTFEIGIGIYGPRANSTLATTWQSRINSRWSTDIVCASNSKRCPVTMKSKVNAYPSKNWRWQVPESNAVYVEAPGYRDISAPLYVHWAEDADELTVVHETGHLMGLYDLYFGKYTLPGFENDIMGNYYTDPGPTQFSGALASILFNHKKGCPCCFGPK
ncbi:DUF4157 domain-containing protein [Iningainema sp. BLCCT55]|uniref:DUF4157 domain-containing protein n=2 Tax=Iningainema TaxID=1932705 RepID=A0A8J6XKR0_9CYAN|nr:DUF4157 domain-containing protein [Iningainema tapete BLCC-T55]